MKLIHIVVLIIILTALSGFLIAKNILIDYTVDEAEYEKLQINIDRQSVHSIEIKKLEDENPLKVERIDSEWIVTSNWGVKARQQRIDALFDGFKDLSGELRGKSESVFKDFEISDDKAFSVALFNENKEKIKKFFIGLQRPALERTFLREDSSNRVYLVNKDLMWAIGYYRNSTEGTVDQNAWTDLSLIKFEADKVDFIKALRYVDGEGVITLDLKRELDEDKNRKQWVALNTEPIFDIDASNIKRLLDNVNSLYVKEAVDPDSKEYGFDSPAARLNFGYQDHDYEIILGDLVDDSSGDRYVKTPEGYVFTLKKNKLRIVDVDFSRCFIRNPLKVESSQLSSVKIKAGKKTISLDEEMIAKNAEYIKKIKKFYVDRMVLDKKYAKYLKSGKKNTLNVEKKDGTAFKLNVVEKDSECIAQIDGKDDIFLIRKYTFNSIFTGLDKLNLSKKKEGNTE
ncbi:DUF4340 domain-containing protein [Candidatus Omnitrophota bacterium]